MIQASVRGNTIVKTDFLVKRQIAAAIGQVRFAIHAAGGSDADVRDTLLAAADRCHTDEAETHEPGMLAYRRTGEA